jgi:arylsulfatase A-like enzyme
MDAQRFSSKQFLGELQSYVTKALIAGIILGLLDFYIGNFFADISIRTFLLFFALYGFGCVLVAVLLGTVIYLFVEQSRRPAMFNIGYILSIAFFLNFVFINIQFFQRFALDNLIGLLTNLVLFVCTIVSAKAINNSKQIDGFVSNIWGYSLVSALIFCLLSYTNYFFFNWPAPLQNIYLAVVLTAFMAITPVLCIFIATFLQNALNSHFKKIPWFRKLLLPVSVWILILMIPQILRFPLLGLYENTTGEISKIDSAKGNDQKPNIIWIVMDTARGDRFSSYGHETHTTPNVDEFRKDAVMFSDAVSAAPWTIPSHASMFTGTDPSTHGAHFSNEGTLKHPLVNENVTIAEILKGNGYKTAAFIANYAALRRSYGFGQGFDLYYDQPSRFVRFYWGQVFSRIYPSIRYKDYLRINRFLLSSEINPMALHWLEENKENNLFLFINYMECHAGYNYIPGEFSEEFDSYNEKALNLFAQTMKKEIVYNKKSITPSEHAVLANAVDARLKYLDHNIGKFFDALKEMGIYDDALIIVTSDHGTLWGEHNSFGHMVDLYNELIHIPLIAKYPLAANKKGISDKRVQSIDIMAEILDYLGIAAPEGIQGQPFEEATHTVVAEVFRSKMSKMTKLNPERYYRDLKALYSSDGKYKYIQASNGQSMLFDLVNDPFEQNNLLGQMPGLEAKFNNQLLKWQESIIPVVNSPIKQNIDRKKLIKDLRALGYIK